MALPTYATLGSLRRELGLRLGYGTTYGQATTERLDSIILRVQEHLYEVLDWNRREEDFPIETVADQTEYPYPETLDPDRVVRARVRLTDRGTWIWLGDGFDLEQFYRAYRSYPLRYRLRDQIEIWPVPDGVYRMVFTGFLRLPASAGDDTPLVMPDRLVLWGAIIDGEIEKGKNAPAQVVASYNSGIRRLRAQQHGDRRYIPSRGRVDTEVLPPPRMV